MRKLGFAIIGLRLINLHTLLIDRQKEVRSRIGYWMSGTEVAAISIGSRERCDKFMNDDGY